MIKVASYNIRKGVGTDRIRSPERILAVLHEIDADVIALQEADRRFGRRAAILGPDHLSDHGAWKALPFGARPLSSGWHARKAAMAPGSRQSLPLRPGPLPESAVLRSSLFISAHQNRFQKVFTW